MNKTLDKTIDVLFKTFFAGAIALAIHSRPDIEIVRSIGVIPDPYKNKTLEQVVGEVKTWDEAKTYILHHISYAFDERSDGTVFEDAPLIVTHETGKEDCDGGASAGAALLLDDSRYNCYIMRLKLRDFLPDFGGHAVALVFDKETKKYGALGINKVDCVPPEFNTSDGVFNLVNASFIFTFEGYSLQEYDKSTLVYGKHFVDDAIDFDRKENNAEICFYLDMVDSKDNYQGKRYFFFDKAPEKHWTYEDWVKATEFKQMYDSTEIDSLFSKFADSVIKIRNGAGMKYLSKENFNYPYASTSGDEISLEKMYELNKSE